MPYRWIERFAERRFSFAAALLVASLLAGAGAWIVGAPMSNVVEPNGEFTDCGPAVFGRLSPLPDPSCGPEMERLVVLTWVLFGLALLSVAVAGALVVVEAAQRRLGQFTAFSVADFSRFCGVMAVSLALLWVSFVIGGGLLAPPT